MSDLTKEVRRLLPCPAYDVEGMESWLTELAREEGLILMKDGIFAGVATFQREEPRQVKYRLEAAPKQASLWDNDAPDPEAVELSREFHWEYVARRGQFYIYRTDDPAARELNTDPEVQALAISALKERRASSWLYLLWWLIVYPVLLLSTRSGILHTVLEIGFWYTLFAVVIIVLSLTEGIVEFRHLRRMEKKLRAGEALADGKNWRRKIPYQVKNLLFLTASVIFVLVTFSRWSAAEERKHQPPPLDLTPPFATITDFGDGGYQPTLASLDKAWEWSDPLAPRNIVWSEHAQVRVDGERYLITGGLEVEYHEMAAPFLARWMARELAQERYTDKELDPKPELPPLDVDEIEVFQDLFPTVVLRKGNVAVRAYFYQTSEEALSLEEWVPILAGSLEG